MFIFIDKERAIFRAYKNQPALLERKVDELAEELARGGMKLVGGDDDGILVNLSGNVRDVFYGTLLELGAYAVSVTSASDIAPLFGGGNIFSHSIARAWEAGLAGVRELLTTMEPDEVADRLERAMTAITNDKTTSPELNALLQSGAESDLVNVGLLSAREVNDYAANRRRLEPATEKQPVGWGNEGDVPTYKNPWEGSGW
jgi:hypothetical protein